MIAVRVQGVTGKSVLLGNGAERGQDGVQGVGAQAQGRGGRGRALDDAGGVYRLALGGEAGGQEGFPAVVIGPLCAAGFAGICGGGDGVGRIGAGSAFYGTVLVGKCVPLQGGVDAAVRAAGVQAVAGAVLVDQGEDDGPGRVVHFDRADSDADGVSLEAVGAGPHVLQVRPPGLAIGGAPTVGLVHHDDAAGDLLGAAG